jgi:preprotein translocase subunit SecE
MARQTRAQRRAARAEQAGSPPRRPPRPTANGEGDGRARRPDARPPQPRERRGIVGRFLGFISESWAELKKVEWPGQSQVIQATVVVLIACVVVGIYLYGNDLVWKHVVHWVLNYRR